MRYIKKYSKFFEDGGDGGGTAAANASTTAGMGAVVASQPGAFAGTTGTTGSGDIGFVLGYDPKKKRKKGSPSQVSDLRDLKEVETEKVKESVDEGSEEYEDIRWALIDFMDQGFDLRIKKYDDPEDIQEMTIAMNSSVPASPDVVTGNNEIRGIFKDGKMSLTKVDNLRYPNSPHFMDNRRGKDREWIDSLESAGLRLLDLEGYDHGSFSISKDGYRETLIPSATHVNVNIHIHMMKDPI